MSVSTSVLSIHTEIDIKPPLVPESRRAAVPQSRSAAEPQGSACVLFLGPLGFLSFFWDPWGFFRLLETPGGPKKANVAQTPT